MNVVGRPVGGRNVALLLAHGVCVARLSGDKGERRTYLGVPKLPRQQLRVGERRLVPEGAGRVELLGAPCLIDYM